MLLARGLTLRTTDLNRHIGLAEGTPAFLRLHQETAKGRCVWGEQSRHWEVRGESYFLPVLETDNTLNVSKCKWWGRR